MHLHRNSWTHVSRRAIVGILLRQIQVLRTAREVRDEAMATADREEGMIKVARLGLPATRLLVRADVGGRRAVPSLDFGLGRS